MTFSEFYDEVGRRAVGRNLAGDGQGVGAREAQGCLGDLRRGDGRAASVIDAGRQVLRGGSSRNSRSLPAPRAGHLRRG